MDVSLTMDIKDDVLKKMTKIVEGLSELKPKAVKYGFLESSPN